jgi:hypothetical protein
MTEKSGLNIILNTLINISLINISIFIVYNLLKLGLNYNN